MISQRPQARHHGYEPPMGNTVSTAQLAMSLLVAWYGKYLLQIWQSKTELGTKRVCKESLKNKTFHYRV